VADICIAFYQPDSGDHYHDGNVALVCPAKGGKIAYDTVELQMRKLPDVRDEKGNIEIVGKVVEREVFVDLLEETYEKALKIVNSNR
jgi:hypothetical protein